VRRVDVVKGVHYCLNAEIVHLRFSDDDDALDEFPLFVLDKLDIFPSKV
jgi:hypothetical protein